MRLDIALLADLRLALRSTPVRLFLVIQAVAGLVLAWRRGDGQASTVLLVWVAMAVLAFFAWWAGRAPHADPRPDPVAAPAAQTVFALLGVAGMTLWGFGLSVPVGFVLVVGGMGGWLWAAWRSGGVGDVRVRLTRDPRPFVPMWLLIAVPRLVIGGLGYVLGATLALPSGIGQQLLFLIGVYAPLEALLRRPDWAALAASLLFALIHVPLLREPNGDDLLAMLANAVLFQASVGLIACLAYQRHRAAVPIGAAHGLAIG